MRSDEIGVLVESILEEHEESLTARKIAWLISKKGYAFTRKEVNSFLYRTEKSGRVCKSQSLIPGETAPLWRKKTLLSAHAEMAERTKNVPVELEAPPVLAVIRTQAARHAPKQADETKVTNSQTLPQPVVQSDVISELPPSIMRWKNVLGDTGFSQYCSLLRELEKSKREKRGDAKAIVKAIQDLLQESEYVPHQTKAGRFERARSSRRSALWGKLLHGSMPPKN